MTIHFGLKLDNLVYPPHHQIYSEYPEGIKYCGPIGLINYLEEQLGIPPQQGDLEYIRIEQFRQALFRYAEKHPNAYYAKSLTADGFATAEYLLARRDELLLAGWDFQAEEQTPERIKVLSHIQQIYEGTGQTVFGFSDRFVEVLNLISELPTCIDKIILNEPLKLLPPHLQALFQMLTEIGVELQQSDILECGKDNDLGIFQNTLLDRSGKKEKITPKGDGSLIIINAKRETDASGFLAKLLKLNTTYKPVCLIPEQNRTLETAMIQEGLPAMGILSSSLSRPTLQILKLVSAFLWKPVDPYKILQFVSLTVKPLHYELGYILANAIARSPGINSEVWRRNVFSYFKQLEERAETDKSIKIKEIRFQYDFWFSRKRYDIHGKVPKADVIIVFNYLSQWAKKQYDEYNKSEQSLLTLSGQAKKITDLLNLLPASETNLTALQVERIVRTIDEPSNVQLSDTEVGSLSFIHHHSAIVQPVKEMIWWNFNDHEEEHRFPKWYQPEIDYLEARHLKTESPELEGKRLLWQRLRPFFQTTARMVLMVQERINGIEAQPHPLYGDLHAMFTDLSLITYDIATHSNTALLSTFILPQQITLEKRQPKQPKPYLNITNKQLDERERESFSSLENLFYFPYKWAFQHKLRLKKSTILSVVADKTLFGNLAHRLFEQLLSQENVLALTSEEIDQFIVEAMAKILETEGATLLLYGREPERVGFLNKLNYAVHALLKHIKENNWTIRGSEMDLEGEFMNVPIRGMADIVLERGKERAIIDLKWPNRKYLSEKIKNREDLQLVLYSKMLDQNEQWAHTAYYIMETGQLYARNNKAFQDAHQMNPNDDHAIVNQEIWKRMENTYQWRMEQIKEGKIEIRTTETAEILEEIGLPAGDMVDFLEMKNENARFDDYAVLLK